MRFLHKLFALYIDSSIHVALAVVAFVGITEKEFGLILPIEFWAFIFLGTISAYNFVKHSKIAGLHHRSLTSYLKIIQVFSVICFLLLLPIVVSIKVQTLLLTAGFGFLTLLYTVPFYHHKNLRMFPGLKIIIVALVWAGVTVILPMVEMEMNLTQEVGVVFIQRALIVIVLILPFDIRDMQYDALSLHTLPQSLGILKTKILGGVILLLGIAMEFLKQDKEMMYTLSFLVFVICLGGFLFYTKKNQSKYFSSFWIEGLPIFWWILLVIFSRG